MARRDHVEAVPLLAVAAAAILVAWSGTCPNAHPSGNWRTRLAWPLLGGSRPFLAVGTQSRHLQLYDVRHGAAAPTVTVLYAHNFAVSGLQADPTRPWQLATYSSAVSEPVKLWDIRRLGDTTPVAEIKTTSNVAVSAIQWSPQGQQLAIALGNNQVWEYEVTTSRPIHTNTVYTQHSILDFASYPFSVTASDDDEKMMMMMTSNQKIVANLFGANNNNNRVAVVDDHHQVYDVARRPTAPLAISQRDGRLVHSFGRAVWIRSPDDDGPAAMERRARHSSSSSSSSSNGRDVMDDEKEDISAIMMRRARCVHATRYAMDAAANIRLLLQEDEDGTLWHLWTWIQRMELLILEEDGDWTSLVQVGTWNLLQMDGAGESEVQTYSEELACTFYDSPDRRYVNVLCVWMLTCL